MTNKQSTKNETMECGCSTHNIQSASKQTRCQSANKPKNIQMANTSGSSALTHWPIQIRLIPAHAPFLKNCDLLVVADMADIVRASW